MFHQIFVYEADIEIKRADFIKTAQDYEHRKRVVAEGGVSVEEFEHAIAFLSSSFFALQMTELLYEKALSLVQGTSIKSHPLVLEAADRVRNAWVQLYRCEIYSPVEGLVAQRKIQVGMWSEAGEPLMSVIPLDQIWVNANYKETQLKKMRIGQSIKLTSDLYGNSVEFHGKIVGLPGAAGNAFSLLPPQNLTGNWIKIVQRLPVRVALDPHELIDHPLRIGLSMEAIADLRDQQGLLVPVNSAGSPTYETPIYVLEELGDEEEIDAIIDANIDPSLLPFSDTPLMVEVQNE
jgi:membrane fusion protein (multidrug efflux system)